MHYWRALKESKFNVVHCDLSARAAWLHAALRLSDMKWASQKRSRGKAMVRGV